MAGIAGPLVISRANNIGAAMAGFCLLGIAFGCQSLCYAIPSEILPRRHRSVSQAAVNMSSGAGAIVAILMGGALLRDDDVENYRIFWYVTAGIYAAGCLGVLVGYNPPPRELQSSLTKYEKLRRLDWIGIALIATGLSLVAIGLQWYGNPYSFTEAPVLAPFIIGVGLIIGFGLYEWRGRCHGILHHALFQHRNFALALGIVFIEGLAFFTANSYFIYELTVLYGLDTFDAGLRFMILFLASIVFAFVVGAYTMRTKQIREPMIIGFALLIAFNALLATLEPSTPLANLWGYAVLGGSGIGFILTNVMVAAQMSTPADMISVTSGLMTATRSLGGAVGLAINNAIFSNSLSSNIFPKISAAVLPLGFPQAELTDLVHAIISGNPHSVEQLPGASAEIVGAALSASKDAYVASFRNAWIAAACFSAVGFLGTSP
jgi:MFS family permease